MTTTMATVYGAPPIDTAPRVAPWPQLIPRVDPAVPFPSPTITGFDVCPTCKRHHMAHEPCPFCKRTIEPKTDAPDDPVNHPTHYRSPSGVECIDVVEHLPFCRGAAIKYIWRAGLKTEDALTDLRKSLWFVQREIARLEKLEAQK